MSQESMKIVHTSHKFIFIMANFTEDLFDVFEEAEDIVEVIPAPVKPRNEDLNTSFNEK